MNVLVADDDPISRRMLGGVLSGLGYTVTAVPDGQRAADALSAADAPELAVLDWEMPGLDGDEVCRAVRGRQAGRYTYLLLVTGRGTKADLVRGLEAGADDYLTKPYDPLELKARLTTGRRILAMQDELIAAREALRVQATRDALTGLWNRAAVVGALGRELDRGGREGRPVGVVLADVDHFKRVNDTYGHAAGDAVLRELAGRWEAAVRPYDQLGRYGGEEFLVVLPGCDEDDAGQLADRLRVRTAAEPVAYAGGAVPVTASFGVAVYHGDGPPDPDALLHRADLALYRAKAGGRNRVEAAPCGAALAGVHSAHTLD